MTSSTQCLDCEHYSGLSTCDAYPDKIPQEIIDGRVDHTTPYDGDNGITFEPIQSNPDQFERVVVKLSDVGSLDKSENSDKFERMVVELSNREILKGEKRIHVKAHKTAAGVYVKDHYRTIKEGDSEELESESEPTKVLMTKDNIKSIKYGTDAGLPPSAHEGGVGLVNFKTGDCGIYKVAFNNDDITGETGYASLARNMGWNIVPQTEKVDFGKGVGTCQNYIYGEHPTWSMKTLGAVITDEHFESLAEMFAMDVVVGNVDRHNENIMIVDDKVWAIDNDTWVQNVGDYNSGDVKYTFNALDYRAEGAAYTKGEQGFNKLCTALEGSEIDKDGFKAFKSIVVAKLEELLRQEQKIKEFYPVDRHDRRDALEYNINMCNKYVEANK